MPFKSNLRLYNVAEAYDACYKKNKPKLTFSKARGATRLEMEEAALEREAARASFGWDAPPSPPVDARSRLSRNSSNGGSGGGGGTKEFREPLATGAGGPRGSVGNQGRDPRAPPVGREREIAEAGLYTLSSVGPSPPESVWFLQPLNP